MFILDDLLMLPAKGFVGILKKVAEVAEDEMTDESRIKEDLFMLQTLYETDQISEEDYERKESELLERLSNARALQGQ
jgi:hypothetical protein